MKLPEVYKVKQALASAPLDDPGRALEAELERAGTLCDITQGAKVGIALGSRRIDSLALIVRRLAFLLEESGVRPVVIPAMGSHGSGKPGGQFGILTSLGLGADVLGVELLEPGHPVKLGTLERGVDIYTYSSALGLDGIIPVNRVAPHTGYGGPVQSGILKMLSVGLGGEKSARSIHKLGFSVNVIEDAGKFVLEMVNFFFGLAIVEDGTKRISSIDVLNAKDLPEREKEILNRALSMYPSLPVEEVDVLVVEEMGKDISGTGMDPLIIGRGKEGEEKRFSAKAIVVFSLTGASRGNATGVGLADVITRRLYQQIDFEATARNVAASGAFERARIPTVASDDREAIQLAVEKCGAKDAGNLRLAIIKNTRSLSEIYVSPALVPALQKANRVTLENPKKIEFDNGGNFISPF